MKSALRTILLVEDDPDIREIASMALELGGYEVVACASGSEAIERVPSARPDMILLDFMMPDMNGAQTLEGLRAVPEAAGVPVAFMTAKAQPTDVANFHALGAIDVIVKPFDPMTLPDRIKAIWDRTVDE